MVYCVTQEHRPLFGIRLTKKVYLICYTYSRDVDCLFVKQDLPVDLFLCTVKQTCDTYNTTAMIARQTKMVLFIVWKYD